MLLLKLDIIAILFLGSLYALSAAARGNTCTCDMPAVMEGEQATLTCFFPEDMKKSTRDILIRHYPVNCTEPEDLIDCIPSESEECVVLNSKFKCGKVSAILTIHLLNATKAYEGRYTCNVIPSEQWKVIPCRFNLKPPSSSGKTSQADDPVEPDRVDEGLLEESEVVDRKKESPEDKGGGNQEGVSIVTVVTVTVITLAAAVTGLIIAVYCRKRKQRRRADMSKREANAADYEDHVTDRKSLNENATSELLTPDKMDDGDGDDDRNDVDNVAANVLPQRRSPIFGEQ